MARLHPISFYARRSSAAVSLSISRRLPLAVKRRSVGGTLCLGSRHTTSHALRASPADGRPRARAPFERCQSGSDRRPRAPRRPSSEQRTRQRSPTAFGVEDALETAAHARAFRPRRRSRSRDFHVPACDRLAGRSGDRRQLPHPPIPLIGQPNRTDPAACAGTPRQLQIGRSRLPSWPYWASGRVQGGLEAVLRPKSVIKMQRLPGKRAPDAVDAVSFIAHANHSGRLHSAMPGGLPGFARSVFPRGAPGKYWGSRGRFR